MKEAIAEDAVGYSATTSSSSTRSMAQPRRSRSASRSGVVSCANIQPWWRRNRYGLRSRGIQLFSPIWASTSSHRCAPDMVQACEAQRAKRGLTTVRFMQGTCPTSTRRHWSAPTS